MSTSAGQGSTGLVYSTDAGRMCPGCRQPRAQCACRKSQPVPAGDGIVRVSLQTKGRAGKGVTLVKGLPLEASALLDLGRQLRAACGSGGTVKEGVIEVQGDHVQRAMDWLTKRGYSVKRAGG
jgi:translation initiation factor 1